MKNLTLEDFNWAYKILLIEKIKQSKKLSDTTKKIALECVSKKNYSILFEKDESIFHKAIRKGVYGSVMAGGLVAIASLYALMTFKRTLSNALDKCANSKNKSKCLLHYKIIGSNNAVKVLHHMKRKTKSPSKIKSINNKIKEWKLRASKFIKNLKQL